MKDLSIKAIYDLIQSIPDSVEGISVYDVSFEQNGEGFPIILRCDLGELGSFEVAKHQGDWVRDEGCEYNLHINFTGEWYRYISLHEKFSEYPELPIDKAHAKIVELLEASQNTFERYTLDQFKQDQKNKLQLKQTELQNEVVLKAGINIVTCGDCGQIILHRVGADEISCHECGFTSEISDFPDLNY